MGPKWRCLWARGGVYGSGAVICKTQGLPWTALTFPETLHEFTSHLKFCQESGRPEDTDAPSASPLAFPNSPRCPGLAAASPSKSDDHTESQAAPRTPVPVHSEAQSRPHRHRLCVDLAQKASSETVWEVG